MPSCVRKLFAFLFLLACTTHALAQGQPQSRVTRLILSFVESLSAVFYTMTLIFTVSGIWLVYACLRGMYDISAGKQGTKPAVAYVVGLFVGGLLTSVSLVAIYIANTFQQ